MKATLQDKSIPLHKRIWRAIIYGVGGAVGSRFLILLSGIIISRIVGKDAYGQFEHVNSTVTTFVTFSGLGMSATLTRFIAANKEDKDKIGNITGTFGLIVGIFAVILSIIMFVFARDISILTTETDGLTSYFQIAAFIMIFASLSAILQSVLLGLESYRTSAVIELIRCLVYVVAAYFLTKQHGVTGAIFALLIGFGLKFILMLGANLYYFKKQEIKYSFSFPKEYQKILLSFTIPAFISSLFVIPINWVANAMLIRSTSFNEMAIFSVARQWMFIITYIPLQLSQMRPIYTDLYENKQYETLFKTVRNTTLFTSAAVLLISILGIVLAGPLLNLYGEGYDVGKTAFRIMMVVSFVIVTQAQLGSIFETLKKMWVGLFLNVIWGSVLLITFSQLTSEGSLGYAIAYLIAYGLHVILSYVILFIIRRKENLYGNANLEME